LRSTLISVFALLLSYAILCLGHGLTNTLLGVRATLLGFPDWVTGLMMSSYFIGFLAGARISSRLISTVGQIRVFAAFASLASAIALLHVLLLEPITWILLRFIYGMCLASLYVVIEGWLNALSTRENRGKILAVYMTINFMSLSLGQFFFLLANPSSFELFAIAGILLSIALVPLSLSKSKQPEASDAEHFGFSRLFALSPLATIGCVSTGLTMGSFWGLSAVYFTRIGLPPNEVALTLSITFFGGFLFQWPIGHLSDRHDRRFTIAGVLGFSAMVCLGFYFIIGDRIDHLTPSFLVLNFFFGGFIYTLYSLFIALANDFLKPQQAVKASGSLIGFHAIGAIFGPLLASLLMSFIGSRGLFFFIGTINTMTFGLAVYQLIKGRAIPEKTHEAFISLPKTTAIVIDLDPRIHGEESAETATLD